MWMIGDRAMTPEEVEARIETHEEPNMSERIEVDNLCGNLGCAMPKMADSDYCPVCMVIAEQSPSVPPSPHDWKPEPPCQAMVEVFVKEIRGNDAVVFMGDEYPTLVPLSSIHPMPGKGGHQA